MKRVQVGGHLVLVPAFAAAAAVVGASSLSYYAGQGLAYLSLAFGALFFVFAARYYVATVSVLLSPAVSPRPQQLPEAQTDDKDAPFVSVHLALYNEERVVERLLTACSSLDYPNYEVIVVDDSTDGTVGILKDVVLKQLALEKARVKVIHRTNRKGFKGGALNEALRHTSPRAQFVVVFDADFVPPADILRRFVAYFAKHGPNGDGKGRYSNGKLAAVQGYQWHTLNRSENWLTRGVSCEFSGNYMVDRTFQEVTGTMKMVAGSVYMVRADILGAYGWSESITEDWELTLRLYEDGHKVLYTPLVLAPAECPSTLGKLIRQRMRWAEGHTYNVKKHFLRVMLSHKIGLREKLEFLYFAPYYLQSAFLILGSLFWFSSDVVLGARLPFITATVGWALVFTNLLALPIMSLTGLFLEKRARKDFPGIGSQLALTYALSPYQAYASLKGLLEPVEGSWVRTFKSGRLSGFPGKLEPRKVIKKVLPPFPVISMSAPRVTVLAALGVAAILILAFAQGGFASAQTSRPAYYFYDSPAPQGYAPFGSSISSGSFLMHLAPPSGPDSRAVIGNGEGSGPTFFSDPSPSNLALPFGASVSIHVWVEAPAQQDSGTQGNLKFRIDIYDPSSNTVSSIPGVGETQVFALQPGVHFYEAVWGNMAQNKMIAKGDTLLVTIWCPDCRTSPTLLFGSQAHPSNIDFPIEVPENSIGAITAALMIPGIAGVVVDGRRRGGERGRDSGEGGLGRIQRTLIVAAALIFLSLPLVITFNELLTSLASSTGLDRVVAAFVPYEASAVSILLQGLGLPAGSSSNIVWIGAGFIPVTALIDWNCAGWQAFVLFGLTSAAGLGGVRGGRSRAVVLFVGALGIFAVNVVRILIVVMLSYSVGYPTALIFHDYGGTLMTLGWLLVFWTLVFKKYEDRGSV